MSEKHILQLHLEDVAKHKDFEFDFEVRNLNGKLAIYYVDYINIFALGLTFAKSYSESEVKSETTFILFDYDNNYSISYWPLIDYVE